jgi:hypothetical protein
MMEVLRVEVCTHIINVQRKCVPPPGVVKSCATLIRERPHVFTMSSEDWVGLATTFPSAGSVAAPAHDTTKPKPIFRTVAQPTTASGTTPARALTVAKPAPGFGGSTARISERTPTAQVGQTGLFSSVSSSAGYGVNKSAGQSAFSATGHTIAADEFAPPFAVNNGAGETWGDGGDAGETKNNYNANETGGFCEPGRAPASEPSATTDTSRRKNKYDDILAGKFHLQSDQW